jgi:hypothetical protein
MCGQFCPDLQFVIIVHAVKYVFLVASVLERCYFAFQSVPEQAFRHSQHCVVADVIQHFVVFAAIESIYQTVGHNVCIYMCKNKHIWLIQKTFS